MKHIIAETDELDSRPRKRTACCGSALPGKTSNPTGLHDLFLRPVSHRLRQVHKDWIFTARGTICTKVKENWTALEEGYRGLDLHKSILKWKGRRPSGKMMINRWKQLDLDDAVAGMILANDVLDAHGGVLLPQKTALTESLLTSLRRRGIDTVQVVNDDISDEELRIEQERVQQRLAVLFRKCKSDGICNHLLQQITEYRLGETK